MTNNEFCIKLYKKQDEMMKICLYHSVSVENSEDIIQECYIKLLKFKDINKYAKDGEVNMYIIFMILRNLIFDFKKKEKRFELTELTDKEMEICEEVTKNIKNDFVYEQMERISYWFDKELTKIYIEEHHTIRSLAKKTNINTNVIQRVIHKFKKKCIENYEH